MSDLILDLDVLRRTALRFILRMIWLQPLIAAAVCWAYGAPILLPAAAALAIAGAAQAFAYFDREGGQARIAAGVALMASISILVGAFNGQKVQVDLHMYYFAALALLVATCDWPTIAAGAVTVAVHHTVLNFFLPSLIYPGGSDFFRLALHATILVIEAGVLIWLASTLERMFGTIKAEAARAAEGHAAAEKSHADAMKAEEEAKAARRLHEQDQARIAEEDHTTLQGLASALERLASGDLTCRITGPLPDKAEPLRRDFNAAVEKLQTAMASVLNTAQAIRSGTGEISAANDDLSRRTEQQAAGVEESAAALDRITATVRHTAGDVVHARDVVGAAKNNAERAGEVVRQAVDAMSGIEQSSRKISQIIGVIDEIAFQTNLLALNAGVEAARAGEAGRGFAVVASEVRALAQRSAEAAKEIKALISTSGQQVAAGVGLVGETGGALQEIAAQVADLADVVTQIAASTQEQTSGLDQVNAAVRQMDQATQQNAAMVEQTTAASHRLLEDNSNLSALLGSFKVEPGAPADTGRRAEAKLRRAG